MRSAAVRLGVVICVFCSACTEPGEQTAIGSATGAALGAGLGAIVGSQTGNAGAGLVVGAVAGGAAGAMVGNALQAQDETMRTQDEAIERQEQFLRAQRAELDELRRTQDPVGMRAAPLGDARGRLAPRGPSSPTSSARVTGRAMSGAMRESDIVQMRGSRDPSAATGRMAVRALPPRAAEIDAAPREILREPTAKLSTSSTEILTPECSQAAGEVRRAESAVENADRLFHYRRALRLCPQNASMHAGLAGVYKRLNRLEDAEFEYQEALRLEPELESARQGLALVQSEQR